MRNTSGKATLIALAAVWICSASWAGQAAPDRSGPGRVLAELTRDLPAALKASRLVLVGTRDPNGFFRVRYREPGWTDTGYEPPKPGHMDGGPGNRIMQIYIHENQHDNALADFQWHQKEFRAELDRMRGASRKVSAQLAPLVNGARRLAELLGRTRGWPAGLDPAVAPDPTGWPGHCLKALADAAGRRDLQGARLWSRELAAALFALEDIHRWLDFLVENQLADLDYMAECRGLFDWHTRSSGEEYSRPWQVSRFPGGSLCISAVANYYEVERQGRRLFRKPEEWARTVADTPADMPEAAMWMPPDLRAPFAALRARLSSANQGEWDRAAPSPFERSFLANSIYRTWRAGRIEAMGTALERYSRTHPQGRVHELMDVVSHRAGLGMAGIEWGDRFDPRLVEGAADLKGDDPRERLLDARRKQYAIYGGGANYQGMVLSLRRALDAGKMDCIRATDMIGAFYRNAGQPGFRGVRWTRGLSGHTIAAVAYTRAGQQNVAVVDGLFAPGRAVGEWPSSYFHGPAGVYAVELSGRGLDDYVLLEAYIIRGPKAGTLKRMRVPYLPDYRKASSATVFEGSYPTEPGR